MSACFIAADNRKYLVLGKIEESELLVSYVLTSAIQIEFARKVMQLVTFNKKSFDFVERSNSKLVIIPHFVNFAVI